MPRDTAIKNVNSLTLAFAKAVGKQQSDKSDNLVVSPYNALACLSMVAKGADTATREELARALFGIGAAELDQAVADLAGLNTEIMDANKGSVELKTANGVWTNKDRLTLNKKFAAELKNILGAEISEETFSDPSVPARINAWAAKNTNNLIDNIIKELNADDAAVLASALYFKGEWTHKFDKAETQDRTFVSDGGDVSVTPTMHKNYKSGQVRYHEGNDYEAVALTYGQEDREADKAPSMRLVLIRPKDSDVSARDWLAAQAGTETPGWMDPYSFRSVTGTVELPRMDIKQKHNIIPALQALGINAVFNEKADLSPMTANGSKDLFVSKASHDVVFKTDEKGSEAAAVTTVVVTMRSAMIPPPPISVKFDRSFVFALQDIKTGAVIFAGAVNKPNKDMKPAKIHPALGKPQLRHFDTKK